MPREIERAEVERWKTTERDTHWHTLGEWSPEEIHVLFQVESEGLWSQSFLCSSTTQVTWNRGPVKVLGLLSQPGTGTSSRGLGTGSTFQTQTGVTTRRPIWPLMYKTYSTSDSDWSPGEKTTVYPGDTGPKTVLQGQGQGEEKDRHTRTTVERGSTEDSPGSGVSIYRLRRTRTVVPPVRHKTWWRCVNYPPRLRSRV